MRLIFDIETNGLLDELDRVHCLVIRNLDTDEHFSFRNDGHPDNLARLVEGVAMLDKADLIAGHNVISFDIPALKKLYPWFNPKGTVHDTIVMTRLMWPKDVLRERDFRLNKEGRLPGNLIGAYSLQAWGHRLTNYKGDYSGSWASWNQEMQDYCDQDVEVTTALYNRCIERGWDERCIDLEHVVQAIITRQENYGFAFDETAAQALYGDLTQRKVELESQLQEAFPPWFHETPFIPKVNNRKMGYVKGELFIKRKQIVFNPSSRDHIAGRLKEKYGWEPVDFTDDGKPKVDEEVLSKLPYPEAAILSEYLMVDKRIGQLATGKEAWLKRVKNGRIHGRVITNGAVTGRMTHSSPNIAQVPTNHAPYGERCRGLFTVTKGKLLLGCDASALELCCLAGYMAKFDGGEYVKTVLSGSKEDGTDIHSVNARALGMDPKKKYDIGGQTPSGRDVAKVWFYAFIYGAGDFKLGTILGAAPGKELEAGKRSRSRFLKNLPALGKLTDRVKERCEGKAKNKDGSPAPTYLLGLDGRRLRCRSSHSALNTLLQSAGAVLMKQALVLLDRDLQQSGYIPGKHYEFVANVHDEWQIEVDKEIAEDVGQKAKAAIQAAGHHFNFGCPLDGEYRAGATWAETH